jgi:hypothetical protein
MYHMLQRLLVAVSALLICAQFGSQSNTQEGRQKPPIDIRGVLIDTAGARMQVHNITISGRITDVVVYQRPPHAKVSPDLHKTEIDLRAVKSIVTLSKNSERYNDRDYIAIDIIANNPRATAQTYLIEASRRIMCEDADGIGNKSISFLAIQALHIESFSMQGVSSDPYTCPPREIDPCAVHDITLTKTMQILEKMETTAQQLPAIDAGDGSLRFTLLKLIDELKKIVSDWFS